MSKFSISSIILGSTVLTATGSILYLDGAPVSGTASGLSLESGDLRYLQLTQTGQFITTGQTGSFGGGGLTSGQATGLFYPLSSNPSGFLTGVNTGSFITSGQTGSLVSSLPQLLLPLQRIQTVKNLALGDNRYSIPQLITAEEDTNSYVTRLSVTTLTSTDTTNTTVLDVKTVRDSINAIYHYVGKPALVDAWFLSTNHNNLTGTTVPAFLSSGNNGTRVGAVTLPSTGVDGMSFVNANSSAIKLPTGLNVYLNNFTDIIIAQPNSVNYTGAGKCLMGNFSQNASGNWGYNIILRDSATPNQQVAGIQFTDVTGGNFGYLYGKPAGMRWQCIAGSYNTGASQSFYLNGRRTVTTGISTNGIATHSRSIGIGGGWITANTSAYDTFNGKIIFACKLSGTYSEETMCRVMSALQSIVSPINGNGTLNLVSVGDSRTGGTEIISGRLAPRVYSADNEHLYWQEHLMTGSNWSGKASPIKLGIGGFSTYSMVNSAYYEKIVRKFRPGWKNVEMTVWAGVNDMGSAGNRSAETTYSLLTGFCARARTDGFKITMLGQLTDYSTGTVLDLKSIALNSLLSGTPIGQYWDRYIPLYDYFPSGIYYDGLHLTDSGNAFLAEILNLGIIPDVLT